MSCTMRSSCNQELLLVVSPEVVKVRKEERIKDGNEVSITGQPIGAIVFWDSSNFEEGFI